ncbi:MAG: ABC transporter permease [Alphaproteobacteria bacterium]|nr:ABC transporter permease [Alphaproteobacteria bacterium]
MTVDAGTAPTGPILAADGRPLKESLRKVQRVRRLRAIALVLPLFVFVLVTFILPIVDMLFRSVDNPVVARNLPVTLLVLEDWNDTGAPGEAAFSAIAGELVAARQNREMGKVASRLNFETSGMRSLIGKSVRKIRKLKSGPYKEAMIKMDKRWGEQEVWATIKRIGQPWTAVQYLAALDLKTQPDGSIGMQPEDRQIYGQIFGRTFWISLLVTVFCLILAYPVSYLLATLPLRHSNLLMVMVLLPFWTSLLVRTTSWIVLLQRNGVVNDLMVWVGVIGEDGRLQMIYNQMGTLIAMTQILLPFMILPLYSVMKTISPSYMQAARSLGARPVSAFIRVYMPLTGPGVGAGCLLVFILSIGYYITPALVGGQSGTMISNFIAYHMKFSLNWGLAAALGTILLAAVLMLYWLYNKIVGIDNMKLG